ncbi:MAG: hypothetical protein A2X86_14500 [Bdellovibrionales bacterium GWA2_49_15]|nr:MAG: hypothetical protein A2X86_14500 [Bdellovibrionales bacterium GWA2_49_15]HAZ13821.1 hypothetical protein [Bdellovibrionales bacterium]
MKLAALTLSLFFWMSSTTALALTCTQTDSGATLLSGQAPNGQPASMGNFELQDQDGMGTCFGNTMSAMLEASLPGHPHLSYQQIAVAYGVSAHRPPGGSGRGSALYTDQFSGRVQTVSEGGFLCAAFEAVKSRNALCTRDEVPLEREGYNQGTLIRGLADFYDAYADLTDDQKRSMRTHLAEVMRATFQRGAEECHFPRVAPVPPVLTRVLQDRCIEKYTLNLEIDGNITRLTAERSSLTGTASEVRDRRQAIDRNIRELRRQKVRVERDLQNLGTVAAVTATTTPDPGKQNGRKAPRFRCTLLPALVSDVESRYYRVLESQGAEQLSSALEEIETRHHLSGVLIAPQQSRGDLRQKYEGDIAYASAPVCRQNQAAMAISNPQSLRAEFFRTTNMCLSEDVFSGLGSAGRTLVGLNEGALPADGILSALARLDQNYDDFLLGAIGPQCLQQINNPPVPNTRPQIPAELSCNSTYFPVHVPTVIGADGEKDLVETARVAKARSEELFRRTIWDSLQNNRPLGIDLCTAFFSGPTADSNYGVNCDATQLHAYHAMTITGRRCVNGEMQYQVQNSWGPTCNYVVNPAGSSGQISYFYECNEDAGYIWVPEDVLLKNTRSLAVLGAAPALPVGGPASRNRRQ